MDITFQNQCDLVDVSSEYDGGSIYVNHQNSYISILENGLIVQKSFSNQGSGGFIYLQNVNNLLLQQIEVFNVSSKSEGRFLYSSSPSANIQLYDSLIQCQDEGDYEQVQDEVQSIIDLNATNEANGAGMYIANANSIIFSQNTFTLCFPGPWAGALVLVHSALTDFGSNFSINGGISGGAIACINCSMYLNQTQFWDNVGVNGGVFYVEDSFNITLDGVSIDTSYALNQGGVFYGNQSQNFVYLSQIIFVNGFSCQSSTAQMDGGFAYFNHSYLSLYVKANSVISTSYSLFGDGGVFYFVNVLSVVIEQSTFSDYISADQGSFLYSSALANFTFTNNSLNGNSQNTEFLILTNSYVYGGAIFIMNAISVQSNNNLYTNHSLSTVGGVFSLINTKFNDSNSEYFWNYGGQGGVISCQNCTFFIDSINVRDNFGTYGCFIYINNLGNSTNTISNSTFINLQATLGFAQTVSITSSSQVGSQDIIYSQGGLLYIVGTSQGTLQIKNITVNNSLSTYGGGLVYSNDPNLVLTLMNSTISCIMSQNMGGGVFNITNANMINITQCSFDTFTTTGAYGSFMSSSGSVQQLSLTQNIFNCFPLETSNVSGTFYISNANILVSSQNQYLNCSGLKQGGVFSLQQVTSFTESNSSYISCSASSGGAISAVSTSIKIKNTTFINNSANDGGVFYFQGQTPLKIDNSTFIQSQSTNQGGLMEVSQTIAGSKTYNISISNSVINGSQTLDNTLGLGGAFFINDISLDSLLLTNNTFMNVYSPTSGGLIYVKAMLNSVQIIQSSSLYPLKFKNITGSPGSILYSISSGLNFFMNYTYLMPSNLAMKGLNPFGTSFYLSSAGKISLTNNIYMNQYASSEGGVFRVLTGQQFIETNSVYLNSVSNTSGGSIFLQQVSQSTISNCSFKNNSAQNGGAIVVDGNSPLIISNSSFSNNFAQQSGGVIAFTKNSISNAVQVNSSLFNITANNNSAGNGGFLWLDNNIAFINISSSALFNHSGSTQGGFTYVTSGLQLNLEKVNITQFSSSQGGFGISTASGLTFNILASRFVCQPYKTTNDFVQSLQNQTYTTTSYFQVSLASSFNIDSSNFSQCGVANQGGVFQLAQTNFNVTNSVFSNSAALSGGVLSSQQSNLYIYNSNFFNNYAQKGGVISLTSSTYLYVINVNFNNNTAFNTGGVILVATDSYFTIQNSIFFNNTASESSVANILGSSESNNVTFNSCQFIQNIADKDAFSFIQANVYIYNSSFAYNDANSRTRNIFCGFSSLFIESCSFTGIKNLISLDQSKANIQGEFFQLIQETVLYIYNSSFKDSYARSGGSIYSTGDSNIQIESSLFLNNVATQYGGAIYAQSFTSFYIGNSTHFINNSAILSGDDIYVLNSDANLILNQSYFDNPNALTSVYVNLAGLTIVQTIFSNILNNQSLQGAAIQCILCLNMLVSQSVFYNLQSQIGGAIYLEDSSQNKLNLSDTIKYMIINSTFSLCQATIGGALYANNPQNLTLINNTFEFNSAFNTQSDNSTGWGGAVYFTCDGGDQYCFMNIDQFNTFKNNTATIQGGAIYWDMLQPTISSQSRFTSNWAGNYGNDYGCYSQQLVSISEEDYNSYLQAKQINSRILTNLSYDSSLQLQDQRSGDTLPTLYLALIDTYGQIVGSDFSSSVVVIVNSTTLQLNTAQYTPLAQTSSQFLSLSGVFRVANVVFTATPGQSYNIFYQTNGIDQSKVSNKVFNQGLKQASNDFLLQISLRNCLVGESFSFQGACSECEAGSTYSLVALTSPGSCQTCPTNKAICLGGSQIGPAPGYWRKNNETTNFEQCYYTPSCLGMISPDFNPIGTCDTGSQGILCGDCQIGYSKSSTDSACRGCPSTIINIVRIFFILLAMIAGIVYLVRSTLLGAHDVSNVTGIYLKIMLNHVQLIMLTASYNLKWPQLLLNFFYSAKPAATVSDQIFSFDCFLDRRNSNEDENWEYVQMNNMRVIFAKLFMYALLPIFIVIVSYLYWILHRCVRKKLQHMRNKIISTIIIILFFVHPNIVQFTFNFFQCANIDGDLRLQTDLQVMCYSSTHLFFSLYIALPCMIIWGFGIPLFVLLMMRQSRNELDLEITREKYGFLYRGYTKEFYFWEIIIMYRKLVLILISVFAFTLGLLLEALLVFIILMMQDLQLITIRFFIVSIKKLPFTTIALNDLELLSLFTSVVSVYCGLFYLAEKPSEWIQDNSEYSYDSIPSSDQLEMFLFILIIFFNSCFFIYWILKMYQEVKSKFRSSLPKIYLFLCLCGKEEKLQKESIVSKIELENEFLREEYYRRLEGLRSLFLNKKIVLNAKNIDKIKTQLGDDKLIEICKPDLDELHFSYKSSSNKSEKDSSYKDKAKKSTKFTLKPKKDKSKTKVKNETTKDKEQITKTPIHPGHFDSMVQESKSSRRQLLSKQRDHSIYEEESIDEFNTKNKDHNESVSSEIHHSKMKQSDKLVEGDFSVMHKKLESKSRKKLNAKHKIKSHEQVRAKNESSLSNKLQINVLTPHIKNEFFNSELQKSDVAETTNNNEEFLQNLMKEETPKSTTVQQLAASMHKILIKPKKQTQKSRSKSKQKEKQKDKELREFDPKRHVQREVLQSSTYHKLLSINIESQDTSQFKKHQLQKERTKVIEEITEDESQVTPINQVEQNEGLVFKKEEESQQSEELQRKHTVKKKNRKQAKKDKDMMMNTIQNE